MATRAYIVSAFCEEGEGGNRASVVLNAEHLSDEQRLRIAAEVGHSETAFVEPSDIADFKVRFFTPTEEVPLCGHATIATYSLLLAQKHIQPGAYTQELRAGVLSVEVRSDGTIWMEQLPPTLSETLSLETLQRSIHQTLTPSDLLPQVVSTGLRDILLPLNTREELDALTISPRELMALNKETNTIGLHAFTIVEGEDNVVAYARNFAPLYGISEESATGSSNGALACYLYRYGKLQGRDLTTVDFRQGIAMGKPSRIHVALTVDGDEITAVKVGGVGMVQGEIELQM